MCFICNDKYINDNNTYDESAIGRCKMSCARDRLVSCSKFGEIDKSSWFYEAL